MPAENLLLPTKPAPLQRPEVELQSAIPCSFCLEPHRPLLELFHLQRALRQALTLSLLTTAQPLTARPTIRWSIRSPESTAHTTAELRSSRFLLTAKPR